MKINNHEITIEVDLTAPDETVETYSFETVEAVANFVEEVSKADKYREHAITIVTVKDNSDSVDGFWRDEEKPIVPLSIDEMLKIRCDMDWQAEVKIDSEADPYEMSLTVGILGNLKHGWKRFEEAHELEWEQLVEQVNEYLNTVELAEYGDDVDVRIFPVFNYQDRYKNRAAKSTLLGHNSIRPIQYGDVIGFIRAGFDATEENVDSLIWVGPKEMFPGTEEERQELFGDQYKRADFVTSSYDDDQDNEVFDFVSCELTEKGSYMIAEGTPISWLDGRDEEYPELTGRWPLSLKIGFGKEGESLEKTYNAILIAVSREYVESDLFEKEALPFASVGNAILVYMDEARLSEERLSKLSNYTEITLGDPKAIETLEAFGIDQSEVKTPLFF